MQRLLLTGLGVQALVLFGADVEGVDEGGRAAEGALGRVEEEVGRRGPEEGRRGFRSRGFEDRGRAPGFRLDMIELKLLLDLILVGRKLGSIRCKQIVGWQHLCRIKARLLWLLEKVFPPIKTQQATSGTSAATYKVMEPHWYSMQDTAHLTFCDTHQF